MKSLADERMLAFCAYCGGETGTRDHVPSKVFLDEPYPDNLPVVPACPKCNQGFSKDEEYMACLIETVVSGSTDRDMITRKNIKEIFTKKPALKKRIEAAMHVMGNEISYAVETHRIENVISKLARGHVIFELNETLYDQSLSIVYQPVNKMTNEEINCFETPMVFPLWPEVGSRAFIKIAENSSYMSDWIEVQKGRYRYLLANYRNGGIVRMVLSEYLACEVRWSYPE